MMMMYINVYYKNVYSGLRCTKHVYMAKNNKGLRDSLLKTASRLQRILCTSHKLTSCSKCEPGV